MSEEERKGGYLARSVVIRKGATHVLKYATSVNAIVRNDLNVSFGFESTMSPRYAC